MADGALKKEESALKKDTASSGSFRRVKVVADDPPSETQAAESLSVSTSRNNTKEELQEQQEEAYPASSVNAGNAFVVAADDAFKQSHQRGKKPRFEGFSMRHWSNTLEEQAKKVPASSSIEDAGLPVRLPTLSKEEIEKHNKPEDMWIVVRGIVYNCTVWQQYHPGGEHILQSCAGKDASEVYDFYHQWVSPEGLLGPFAVGRLG